MSTVATRNPIRTKARQLLRRFLDSIEKNTGGDGDPDEIPGISNAQWRTLSAVLATYRLMVDEHQVEAELELARLDYSKLSVDEILMIVARHEGHPQLAGLGGEEVIDVKPGNGGLPR